MFIRWRADVFNLHRALYYRASHGIFIALPMIQRRSRTGTAKNCQWTMRKTGKLDNKVLNSSPLFHRTGSVSERFRNNVEYRDTEILVEIYICMYLINIYMYICVLWDCNVEIFIFHVNSEKIGRCNCPARNRLHWKGSARFIEEFSGWFRMWWMGIDLSLEHERYEGKQNYLVLISSVILLRKCKEKSVYQLFRSDFI